MEARTERLILNLLHQGELQGSSVFLDIETYQGDPDLLDREIRWETRKEQEKVILLKEAGEAKWEKEQEKLDAKIEKMREMAAVKDSARIISVAICLDKERHVVHYMPIDEQEERELADLHIISHHEADEKTMLKAVMGILDSWEPIRHLVTFAGSQPRGGFDLPKLRLRSAFHNIKKAQCLTRSTETVPVDLMYEYCKYHSTRSVDYAKLGYVADMLGLDSSKIGDGGEVAGLYESGDYVTLLAYNVYDCVILQDIYARMF